MSLSSLDNSNCEKCIGGTEGGKYNTHKTQIKTWVHHLFLFVGQKTYKKVPDYSYQQGRYFNCYFQHVLSSLTPYRHLVLLLLIRSTGIKITLGFTYCVPGCNISLLHQRLPARYNILLIIL